MLIEENVDEAEEDVDNHSYIMIQRQLSRKTFFHAYVHTVHENENIYIFFIICSCIRHKYLPIKLHDVWDLVRNNPVEEVEIAGGNK